jgi:hypothetical protein
VILLKDPLKHSQEMAMYLRPASFIAFIIVDKRDQFLALIVFGYDYCGTINKAITIEVTRYESI